VLCEWASFPRDRVVTIPNGADLPVAAQVPRRPGAPLRLGFVGRLTRGDKRVDDLVELHRELAALGTDYRLEIVGDGPRKEHLAQEFSQSANVTLHGARAHSELYSEVFPNLDALVLTSASEAFGIVLIEAMMHGVVPVSSRYDGFQAERLVEDEIDGLSFEVGDMAAAARRVDRLARDPGLLIRLSNGAKAKAAAYSWPRALESWQGAIKQAMSRESVRGTAVPQVPGASGSSRLEQLGISASVVDVLRRVRRATLGPAVPAGGEEWPLFLRHHSEETLAGVTQAIRSLDVREAAAA
jgi:glycosyltransferase involved in cell wall biosynthesis